MTIPSHHPGQELLLDYADGSLPETAALLLATHLALCPLCREQVTTLEAIGGALLDDSPPEPVSADCLEALLSRLEEPEVRPATPPPARAFAPLPPDLIVLPQPLRSYVGAPLNQLTWHPLAPGVEETEVAFGADQARTRLLRFAPGSRLLRHSHDGTELTLVLDGVLVEGPERLQRGDVSRCDPGHNHEPLAEGACLCLVVSDAPLRANGGAPSGVRAPEFL